MGSGLGRAPSTCLRGHIQEATSTFLASAVRQKWVHLHLHTRTLEDSNYRVGTDWDWAPHLGVQMDRSLVRVIRTMRGAGA